MIGDNHKGETLYRWETSSGKVWKGFGDKDTQSKYVGEIENGEPNGLGVLTISPTGTRVEGKYVGEWKAGKRNGQGTFTVSDRTKYVGEFKNGKMVKGMVKEEIRGILEITMLGNGVMGRCVREHFTIKMER